MEHEDVFLFFLRQPGDILDALKGGIIVILRRDTFILKTINYKSNSVGVNHYEFDSVWTNANYIYLRHFSNRKKQYVRKFPLGSVGIKTSSDSIGSIEIFGELTKNMDFIYKNPDGSVSTNLLGIGTTTYEYTPTKKISPKDLNKTKIFYEKY